MPVLGSGPAASVARGVLAAILLVESAALLYRKWGLRRAVAERLVGTVGGPAGGRFLFGPVLALLGLVFAGVGAFELVRAAQLAL